MGSLRYGAVAALAALFLHACDSGEPPSPVAEYMKDPAAVKRGKRVFAGSCGAYCHKMEPGPGDIPYLFDCAWKHGGSDHQIFETIRDGVPGSQMIGFGSALPDGEDDIWKVIAYLKANSPCQK